jgi:hypothetical protein
MKTSIEFQTAKKSKELRSILVMQQDGKQFVRLCLNEKSKYNNDTTHVFVETPTQIFIQNYSCGTRDTSKITKICFHFWVYEHTQNHINTFLNSIKKESELHFRVIAYNSSDNWDEAGFVNHKLYAIVDNKEFLLGEFTGKDNSASPII